MELYLERSCSDGMTFDILRKGIENLQVAVLGEEKEDVGQMNGKKKVFGKELFEKERLTTGGE